MANDILRRNYVNIKGKGDQTVVFAHGFGCDQTVWKNIVPEFENNYRIVLFDYVGSGNSERAAYSVERYNSLHGYKQDLFDVCDALDLENIILIAHSVSGMIGALASIERPQLISRLIMISPSSYYLNEPGYEGGFTQEDLDALLNMMEMNYKEWAKYLAPVVMKNEDRPQLTEAFEERLNTNDPTIARQFAQVTFSSDSRAMLADISVPVLILQTQQDAIAPVTAGRYVHEHIKNSEFVLMEAAGHNPHISDPEETTAWIKAYLEKTR